MNIIESFLSTPRGKSVVGDANHVIEGEWIEKDKYLKLHIESIEDHPFTRLIKHGTYEAYFDQTERCISDRAIG